MSEANESLLTWPAKIWLQREHEDEAYIKACGMTWCEDAIGDADVTYVREDLMENEIAALKAALEEAREIIAAVMLADRDEVRGLRGMLTDDVNNNGDFCQSQELAGALTRARAFIAKMEAGNVST